LLQEGIDMLVWIGAAEDGSAYPLIGAKNGEAGRSVRDDLP
jgi:hypothetical protein